MTLLSKKQEWILWLYELLSEATDEQQSADLVALIDQEEAQLPTPPPRGTVLDDILLKPWRSE